MQVLCFELFLTLYERGHEYYIQRIFTTAQRMFYIKTGSDAMCQGEDQQ